MRLRVADPLQHPLAVLAGSLVVVLGVRGLGLGWGLTLPAALLVTIGLAQLRSRPTRQGESDLIRRSRQLSGAAGRLADEAAARLNDPDSLARLSALQLCCQRIAELPARLQRLEEIRPREAAPLLSAASLRTRLRQEARALRQSPGPTALSGRRRELIRRLEENIALAERGAEAQRLQQITLVTLLEGIAGELQDVQVRLQRDPPAAAPGSVDPHRDPLLADLAGQLDALEGFLEPQA
ncbi:hypothetical protein EVJ50_01130 [Synechococcus sp. RSCCF101]|uniref:hypothetical protein n=1 Tax=Synechococcus sp. RSCCF101 TaxID=2511069 RepID=UPI0012464548|nr:hypothetical protein [Synechococcus sp. RSCCF101]QEY31061.1 hypothetical protein EVJ50_01130 [Synechococcus sp. RSCCF101]